MTMCDQLSDRMVAVAKGAAQWTAAEREHLAGCPGCAAEWRVVEQGRALGGDLAPLDLDRVVAGVRARLATAPVAEAARPRWRIPRPAYALAAAAVVLLAVWLGRPGDNRTAVPPSVAASPSGALLSELDDLSSGELERVLDDWEGADPDPSTGIGDLDSDELERVLRAWES